MCVEDCSPDNTLEVLQKYKELHPDKITLIKNPNNLGPGETRNRGLYLTQDEHPSDYIWMVDGDDRLVDDTVIQRIYDYSVEHPDKEMICLGMTMNGKYVIASVIDPNGPMGMVLKPSIFVPYLDKNVQGCEDVYQHFVQWDSVEDSKIGVLDYLCYTWRPGNHRTTTNVNSRKVVMDALKQHQFKKENVRNTLINFRGNHISWYTASP